MTAPVMLKDPILGGAAPGALSDVFATDFSLRNPEQQPGPSKMRLMLMLAVTSIVSLIVRSRVGVKATGSITVVAGAALADEDNFTLDDGFHAAKVFEYDDDAALSIGGAVGITFTGASTLAQVRTATIAAINGAAGLDITATPHPTDPAVILLENDHQGTIGNEAVAEDVADAGFEVSGMEDGEGDTAILPLNAGDAVVADTLLELESWIVHEHTYNLHLTTNGAIKLLYLLEKS